MALILSGSVDVGGSMTATTILVSAPGGGGMISSSQQIQNYNTFAVTSSANTFYGNQTLSGSLAVTNTTSIGTTNTSYKLNVGGGLQLIDNSPSIRLKYSSGASVSDIDIANNYDTFALQFYGNTTMDNYILYHNETSGYTMFQTAGTERVRINSTGLGIGKTPSSKLDVNGNALITGSLSVYQPLTNTTSYLTIQNNRARNAAVYTQTTNGGFYAGTSIGTDTFNYQIYDAVAGSARLTISSTGAATFTDTVTANTGFKLPANGNGTSPTIAYNNSLGFGVNGTGLFFGNLYNSDLTTAMQLRVTNSGGTDVTAMTILSSGNVGVATTTPGYKLDVNGDFKSGTSYLTGNTTFFSTAVNGAQNYGGSTIRIVGGTGTSAAGIQFGPADTNTTGARGRIGFLASANNGNPKEFAIIKGVLDSTGANTCNGSLTFHTLNGDNASEAAVRMTIDGSGNIGAASGTNIYNASDARLKQNITSISGSLNSVLALNPVKFNWVDDFVPSENGKDMLGFVAQEIQTIVPEAVESFGADSIFVGETEIDNPLRVNEKFLIPVLTKAIQEQQAIIDGLIARIEALENN